jgi:hypothetical protein
MKRIFPLIALCILLPAVSLPAGVEIWPVPAETKITRLDTEFDKNSHIWTADDPVVRLTAAGGEHAFFQVIAAVDRDSLRGVTVEAGAFAAKDGKLPAGAVRIYLCPAVKVYAPSTEKGKAGWYPDPLVRLTRPVDIAPYRWQRHNNQTFWVEIEVPRGQKAGVYRGEVIMKAGGSPLAAFPVELTVRSFDLPPSFHQYALFECSRDWLRGYYDDRRLAGRNLDDVLAAYFDFMLERGVQPWSNPLIMPESRETADSLTLSWPNSKWEQHFLNHPAYRRITFPVTPRELERRAEHEKFTPAFDRKVRDWVGGIYEHYRQNGWQKKLTFFGPVDEPSTREEYQELIEWGKLVRSVNSGIGYQVSEQPLPQEPSWPSLASVATDWVVHGSALEGNRVELLKQLAAGNNACWYISCDQTWPMANYFIDEPGIDPRAVAWITYNYQLEGILYWAINFWTEVKSPWRDPVTWKRSECNAPLAGEGSLVYPGEEIEDYCGQENVAGPVSSIRLELLRKGMEDIEYIYLLADRGRKEDAMRLCMELVISVDTFSRDLARYEKVKEEAARLLAK